MTQMARSAPCNRDEAVGDSHPGYRPLGLNWSVRDETDDGS